MTYHHICLAFRTYQTFHPFRPTCRSVSASRPPSTRQLLRIAPVPSHPFSSVPARSRPPEEPTLSGDTPAARPPARPHPPAPRCGIPWQNRLTPPSAAGLDRFNALPRDRAVATLLTCCGCLRWAERIAAHRPYPDPESLLAAGDEAGYDLSPAEQAEALAQEAPAALPPVRPGPGTLAAHTALRAAHAAYELRFRHAFVICLDGYRDDELMDQTLHAIRTRLAHEPDEERSVAADHLRRLARVRLGQLAATCP
ncbi:2-oxo-4-hydroxy-4-carboxy-5-ureidoimidazoline decarboxylase [Streptomyces sp. NPDC004296]|uniref:2-oxo-4-hydroxy-4-carboxy-5-ureidoimidazoline decarboxylase n=1 Tax=Streptomyces sp. NPDC004296 TaxID=3364697 RepID=UPI0036A447EA